MDGDIKLPPKAMKKGKRSLAADMKRKGRLAPGRSAGEDVRPVILDPDAMEQVLQRLVLKEGMEKIDENITLPGAVLSGQSSM